MSDKRIRQLNNFTTLNNNDVLIIDDGITKKVKYSYLISDINTAADEIINTYLIGTSFPYNTPLATINNFDDTYVQKTTDTFTLSSQYSTTYALDYLLYPQYNYKINFDIYLTILRNPVSGINYDTLIVYHGEKHKFGIRPDLTPIIDGLSLDLMTSTVVDPICALVDSNITDPLFFFKTASVIRPSSIITDDQFNLYEGYLDPVLEFNIGFTNGFRFNFGSTLPYEFLVQSTIKIERY